jgi:hypothetical protein
MMSSNGKPYPLFGRNRVYYCLFEFTRRKMDKGEKHRGNNTGPQQRSLNIYNLVAAELLCGLGYTSPLPPLFEKRKYNVNPPASLISSGGRGRKLVRFPDYSSIRLGRLFVYIFLHKLNQRVYDIVLAMSGRVGGCKHRIHVAVPRNHDGVGIVDNRYAYRCAHIVGA